MENNTIQGADYYKPETKQMLAVDLTLLFIEKYFEEMAIENKHCQLCAYSDVKIFDFEKFRQELCESKTLCTNIQHLKDIYLPISVKIISLTEIYNEKIAGLKTCEPVLDLPYGDDIYLLNFAENYIVRAENKRALVEEPPLNECFKFSCGRLRKETYKFCLDIKKILIEQLGFTDLEKNKLKEKGKLLINGRHENICLLFSNFIGSDDKNRFGNTLEEVAIFICQNFQFTLSPKPKLISIFNLLKNNCGGDEDIKEYEAKDLLKKAVKLNWIGNNNALYYIFYELLYTTADRKEKESKGIKPKEKRLYIVESKVMIVANFLAKKFTYKGKTSSSTIKSIEDTLARETFQIAENRKPKVDWETILAID
ncbi:hypothetical protein [Parasediminibacterium sp. JCM 36343]|uniref:hypothetical protein n=1 Tax=Parasediminibacterium sp. JCM 36343 TaxID=3374279 RepID=UPI0039799987